MARKTPETKITFAEAFNEDNAAVSQYLRANEQQLANLVSALQIPDETVRNLQGSAREDAKAYNRQMKRYGEGISRGYVVMWQGEKAGYHFPEDSTRAKGISYFGQALSGALRLARDHGKTFVAQRLQEELQEFYGLAKRLGESEARKAFADQPGGQILAERALETYYKEQCGIDTSLLRQR